MKTKLLTTVLFISCCILNTSAQNTFQKTIGNISNDELKDLKQTSDGGFILIGNSDYNGTDEEIVMGKTDADGSIQWASAFESTQFDEVANAIEKTSDGGFIIAGTRDSGPSNTYDIIVIKTDSLGYIQWSEVYGEADRDEAFGIHQTFDGGYIINGMLTRPASGYFTTFLIKINSIGTIEWSNTYEESPLGITNSCKQLSDSSFIVCGSYRPFGPVQWNYIFKADVMGNLQWFKLFTAGLSNISETSDGGFIATGSDSGAVLIKLDSTGAVQWARTFYTGMFTGTGKKVSQTTDGGYFISGITESNGATPFAAFIIKTDSSGTMEWNKYYGQTTVNNSGFTTAQTSDGGFVIGMVGDYFGDEDFYLIKTDINGNSGCNDTIGGYIPSTVTILDSIISVIPVSIGTQASISFTTLSVPTLENILCSSTGIIEGQEASSFTISPNPTSSTFAINTTTQLHDAQVEIYNVIGEKVYKTAYHDQLTVSCELFSKGIYFVRVSDGEKQCAQKLIMQ